MATCLPASQTVKPCLAFLKSRNDPMTNSNQISLKEISENMCGFQSVCRLTQFSMLSKFLIKHSVMPISVTIIQSGGEQM
jgi:hypothetical protein